MYWSVHNNILAMNANNQLKIGTGKNVKSSEKLSSGYRINRSADDASGLAMSEKMRRVIRGLHQGTENAQDGVSWVQIGDGTLNEVHDILHRMEELTVKSLNGTNTEEDRAAMQQEFDQLQSEVDRITKSSVFNEKNVFQQHQLPYFQYEGNRKWPQDQKHAVVDGANDLVLKYRIEESDVPKEVRVTVPAGVYTTQELIDELDDAISAAGIGLGNDGIVMEYTAGGTCNLNLEKGFSIDDVEGGLSYLMYDFFGGGSLGALIGTTQFLSDSARLPIVTGQNDELSFWIESTDGSSVEKRLTLPAGHYTRQELIDKLNDLLSDTTVTATQYGTGIKLASEESIITGFKGNMFKIDHPEYEDVYSSVFYDNVNYSTINLTQGIFTGGAVLTANANDPEYNKFHITDSNNKLTFLANNSGREVTITLRPGDYDADSMARELNTLFAADDTLKDLRASSFAQRDAGNAQFYGIQIQSGVRGIESKVGILKEKSSAYDTLFVTKAYNGFSGTVSPQNASRSITATLDGKKGHAGGLEIRQGVNDQFKLTLNNDNNDSFTITLASKTYANADELRDEINRQLGADAPAALKNRVTANVETGGTIRLTGDDSVNAISVAAIPNNDGYKDLFVGLKPRYDTLPHGRASSVTLPESTNLQDGTVSTTVAITGANRNLGITVDGVTTMVQLPVGDAVTQEQIKNAIDTQMANVKTDLRFTTIDKTGDTVNPTASKISDARTYYSIESFNKTGVTEGAAQGVAGELTKNEPAQVVLSKSIADTVKIDRYNNTFSCTVNNRAVNFTIAEGTYSRADLISALQAGFDAQCGVAGDQMGGVTVSAQPGTNYLTLTAGIKAGSGEAYASNTRIALTTGNCSFLQEMYATSKTQAAVMISEDLKTNNFTFNNDTFSFTVTSRDDPDHPQNVTVNLNDTYADSTSLLKAINDQVGSKGVTASIDRYSRLVLSTKGSGNGYDIAFGSLSDGCKKGLYGESTPATGIIGRDIKNDITTIEAGANKFRLTINRTSYTAELDAGTYTKAQLASALQTKINEKASSNDQVRVKLTDNNWLQFETVKTGSDSRLYLPYNSDSDSAMRAIFGQSSVAAVTAGFDADNRLVLTRDGSGGNGTVSVNSQYGSVFYLPDYETAYPERTNGLHEKAYIDGVDLEQTEDYNALSRKVTIDAGNQRLRFHSAAAGGYVDFTLDQGTYSFSELETALQEKLDETAGSGKYVASVTDKGVRIEAGKPGNNYNMSDFSGGFYYKVICPNKSTVVAATPTNVDGKQFDIPPYVMGRKDVKNVTTTIREDTNDVLSLDYNDGLRQYKFTMKLDPGSYSGSQLVRQIQGKLNEKLVAAGLPANLIEAGIGGINTGVNGSNDDNALNFKLSSTIPLSHNGRYVIDGIGGSAAFSVFYQTEGDIARAYVTGGQDLSDGLTIEDGENDFSFKIDGTPYSITLSPGTYTAQELADAINDQFGSTIPLKAQIKNGNLRLEHTKYGQRNISDIGGALKSKMFYKTVEDQGPEELTPIKLSSAQDDKIVIGRPVVNSVSLGINSVCISGVKYAEKALDRIKQANSEVSRIRSDFGSLQNRIEHSINNNENKEENMTAAESAIRDTDMSTEAMTKAIMNIQLQAVQAMMAQANQQPAGILQLLQ